MDSSTTIDSEEELTELLNEIEMALRDDLEPTGPPVLAAPGHQLLSYVETQKSAAESWGLPRVLSDGTPVSASKPVPRNTAGCDRKGSRTG